MKRIASLIFIMAFLAAHCSCSPAEKTPASSAASALPAQTAVTDASNPVTLTIASLTDCRAVDYAITAFEGAHPGIQVKAVNFDSQIAGLKQSMSAPGRLDLTPMAQALYTEIMAGNGPDIILVNDLPFYKLIAKDVFADIGALMDADKSFDKSLYYSNVFDACRTNGKLYAIPACFSFYVLACRQQYSPGAGNVTMQQFLDKAQSLPSGIFAFAKNDPMQIASDYLQDSFSTFVDYGAKTANFSSPEFISTIKGLKTLFDTKMSGQGPQDGGELEQLMKGTVAYSAQTIRNGMDLCMAKSALGQDAVFTNIPTMAGGSGYTFTSSTMLAINAQSKNRDAAWEFIKTMLSEDGQTNGHPDGFPVIKSACQNYLDDLTAGEVMLDKSGGRMTVMLGGTNLEIKPLSSTDAAFLSGRFGKLNKLSIFDDSIVGIIMDELPAFFAGQKSAEAVAALIQNRVNIVLNE
jgi:multiple sugar transport system substrate-binding protein